jgi:UDP-3-O-[3-hydroxymyristoyl] glucosamine N-acyltransferase
MSAFSIPASSPALSVEEIVALTGALPLDGTDLSRRVSGIAPIDRAVVTDLSFVADAKFTKALAATKAGVVLTTAQFAGLAPADVSVLQSKKPYEAFVAVASQIYRSALRPVSAYGTIGIAPNAAIHPSARLAPGVTVDPFAVIGPGAVIGSGSLIGAHAVVGDGVTIGDNCAIGPHCAIIHSRLGDRVIVHAGCHIGQDGFGYVSNEKGHQKIPQIGHVIIEADVEIGAGTNVDRGGMRDTTIGKGTKIDNLCQIGHNCSIGKHCIIVAQCGLSGSVTLEDFVVLGPRTGIIPHVTIGKGAVLASRSTVYEDVPAGETWGGFPAKPRRRWLREVVVLEQLAARGSSKPRP